MTFFRGTETYKQNNSIEQSNNVTKGNQLKYDTGNILIGTNEQGFKRKENANNKSENNYSI